MKKPEQYACTPGCFDAQRRGCYGSALNREQGHEQEPLFCGDANAEQVADCYMSVFPNSRKLDHATPN